MQKTKTSSSDGTLVGLAFLAYIAMCGVATGRTLCPIAFFLWLFVGRAISRWLAMMFILGDSATKENVALAFYFTVFSLISLLAVI